MPPVLLAVTLSPWLLAILTTVVTGLVMASLGGMMGTGLVNLANSEKPSKWVVWAIQGGVCFIGLVALAVILANKQEHSAVRELRRVMQERFHQDVHEILTKSRDAQLSDQSEGGGDTDSARIGGGASSLRLRLQEAERDALRIKTWFLSDHDVDQFTKLIELIRAVRGRVAVKYELLVAKGVPSEADFADLFSELDRIRIEYQFDS